MQLFFSILICFLFSLSAIAQETGHQTPSENLVLELDSSQSNQILYEFPFDAFVKLPTSLSADKISSSRVKVYFNLDLDGYDFHCYYQPYYQILEFEKCETMGGELLIKDVEDLRVFQFPIYKASSLKMEILNSIEKHIRIKAIFDVNRI